MSLGENIYRLRTEKGMSQGDLADALQVSRQSVSKWETDGATPDLEKIVKLSSLFGITLDELVKGEGPQAEKEPQPQPEPQVIYVERAEPAYPRRKIAGLVLYGLALLVVLLCTILGSLLGGVLYSLPFWTCGVICFVFKQRVGLWCSWALFFLVDIFLRFASGVTWGGIFTIALQISRGMNIRWIVSLALTLVVVGLVCWTIWSFRDKTLALTQKVKIKLLCCGGLLALLYTPWSPSALGQQLATDGESLYTFARIMQVVSIGLQWGKIILICILLIDLFAVLRWKKANKAE